jgi:hypothetical protein
MAQEATFTRCINCPTPHLCKTSCKAEREVAHAPSQPLSAFLAENLDPRDRGLIDGSKLYRWRDFAGDLALCALVAIGAVTVPIWTWRLAVAALAWLGVL